MDFYNKLKELGLLDILNPVPFSLPQFFNWDTVFEALDQMYTECTKDKSKKVLVYGDYDVDGAMSAKIMLEALKDLNIKNVDVYNYHERTHLLDKMAVQQCIMGRYDYFIVCDTGSSDIELLQRMTILGTKIIILDHHVTTYDYDDFDGSIAIINTYLENQYIKEEEEKFKLSAGALCYVVCRKFFEQKGLAFNPALAAYATVSLFADCMTMRNKLNRAIYYEAQHLQREELPKLLLYFMNEFSAFNARYIGFWFAPRINSLFRSENFEVLNKIIFYNLDNIDIQYYCARVEEIYEKIRSLVQEVADIITVQEYDNFVVGDLYSVDRYFSVTENKLYNYTGLVANILSDNYGKTAVVHCRVGSEIKGSVRDLFGRNYLRIFQQFCHAGGHPPAFGIRIYPFDFDDFISNLEYVDKNLYINGVENEPIVIDAKRSNPDNVLIEDIALYNEFSGYDLPVVYVRKQVIGAMREVRTKYNYQYKWGKFTIQSEHSLPFGSYVLVKPIKSLHTKLLVQ